MIAFPPAKINIGLYVTARRTDGFHNLLTVFYPVPFCDVLEVFPLKKQKPEFHFYGLPIPGKKEDNLLFKAWELYHSLFQIPAVEVHLLKNIPMGAGLGGGSSDAATLLNMLNELFSLNLTEEERKDHALTLGSDCPFFINPQPAIATGRGEMLTYFDLNLKEKTIVIVFPGHSVSTKEAFQNVQIRPPETDPYNWGNNPQNWQEVVQNGFEPYVLGRYPELKELKTAFYAHGAQYASMTGSGSAFFGIFSERKNGEEFEKFIRKRNSGYTVRLFEV